MDFADLKMKTVKELQDLLKEKTEELRSLRFKASERQLKAVRTIRNVRRDIAQIMTQMQDTKSQK